MRARTAPVARMRIAPQVQLAIRGGRPVVALESALITHGLPHPLNLEVAGELETEVTREGAIPATIAVIRGELVVGTTPAELSDLAMGESPQKIGLRDLAAAQLRTSSGGTTVSATVFAAHEAGIAVLATGGIGGVHRGDPFDVSADLEALGHIPIVVVCAGAKAILDVRATAERLETLGVPVVGYRTGEFPAFYSRSSGIEAGIRLDTPADIAALWAAHRALGIKSAILVGNPISSESEIAVDDIESMVEAANREAEGAGIHGQALTPFLLGRLHELSQGRTTRANVALLHNNARLGAQIAVSLSQTNPHERLEP